VQAVRQPPTAAPHSLDIAFKTEAHALSSVTLERGA
jgi:hypothetical protein